MKKGLSVLMSALMIVSGASLPSKVFAVGDSKTSEAAEKDEGLKRDFADFLNEVRHIDIESRKQIGEWTVKFLRLAENANESERDSLYERFVKIIQDKKAEAYRVQKLQERKDQIKVQLQSSAEINDLLDSIDKLIEDDQFVEVFQDREVQKLLICAEKINEKSVNLIVKIFPKVHCEVMDLLKFALRKGCSKSFSVALKVFIDNSGFSYTDKEYGMFWITVEDYCDTYSNGRALLDSVSLKKSICIDKN